MNTLIKTKEEGKVNGVVTVTSHKKGTIAVLSPYIKKFNEIKQSTKPFDILLQKELVTKINTILAKTRIGEKVVQGNLIMQSANHGKDIFIQRLLGINTYSLNLTYGEIGTGGTTPAITDTALTTPVARASLNNAVSVNIGNNQAQIQYFFPDASLTNSTYTEFGTFVDGSASIGTGQLFNHALFATPYVKNAGVDVTVQVNITIN